jgi:hypothetical protein
MLSSVLRSPRSIKVNIEIVRVFVRLRQILSTHNALARKLAELELRIKDHDGQIHVIFEAIRQLVAPTEARRKKIGFKVG